MPTVDELLSEVDRLAPPEQEKPVVPAPSPTVDSLLAQVDQYAPPVPEQPISVAGQNQLKDQLQVKPSLVKTAPQLPVTGFAPQQMLKPQTGDIVPTPGFSPDLQPQTFEQKIVSDLKAMGKSAGFAVVPSATGIALGKKLSKLPGPPIAKLAYGLAGMVAGSLLGNKLQELGIMSVEGKEKTSGIYADLAKEQEEHPISTFVGELLPMTTVQRMSIKGLQLGYKAAKKLIKGEKIIPPEELSYLQNMIAGSGLGFALEAFNQYMKGDAEPLRLIASTVVGAALNKQTKLGRKIFGGGKQAEAQREQERTEITTKLPYTPAELKAMQREQATRSAQVVEEALAKPNEPIPAEREAQYPKEQPISPASEPITAWHYQRTKEPFSEFNIPAWFSKNPRYATRFLGGGLSVDEKLQLANKAKPFTITPKGKPLNLQMDIGVRDSLSNPWKGATWIKKIPELSGLLDPGKLYVWNTGDYPGGVIKQKGVVDALSKKYDMIVQKEAGFDVIMVLNPKIISPASKPVKISPETRPTAEATEPTVKTAPTSEPAGESISTRPYSETYKEAKSFGVGEGDKSKPALEQRLAQAKQGTEITGDITKDASPAREVVEPQGEMRESSVPTKALESTETPEVVKIAIEDSGLAEHPTLKNVDLMKFANDKVSKSVMGAHDFVMSGPLTPERVAVASVLRDKYRAEGNGKAEFELIEKLNEGIGSGRIVQAMRLWYRGLSPDGFMAMVRKDAKRKGYTLTPEQEQAIRTKKDALDVMPEGEAKDQARRDLVTEIAGYTPAKIMFWDALTAYRYSNALSSPRSTLRNLTGNLIQTLITRPSSLLGQGKIVDAVRWWHDMSGQWTLAFKNFMTAMKDADIGKWQEQQPATEIGLARQQRIPYFLRAIPQFMNAQDKFFSTFIIAGEKQRLMRSGVGEEAATRMAEKLAEKYLYREDLAKASTEYNPLVTRGINSLGLMFQRMTELPVIGNIAKPFLMFIRTPTNVAKFIVESSPFGISKHFKKLTPEQLAKEKPEVRAARLEREYIHQDQVGRAIFGSLLTAIGGMMAMAGNTTWAAPLDEKRKTLWYATGRKPYSVKVGDKWVPMWYFGPFAMAFAIPAAVADYTRDNPNKLTKTDMQKLTGVANGVVRFIGSQTSMQGAANVFSVLEGRGDMTFGKAGGFASTQFIPMSGMVRYVNSILDPKFRKSSTFTESIKKDMLYLSKDLEAYVDPQNKPVERVLSDWLLPWTLGTADKKYEPKLEKMSYILGMKRKQEQEINKRKQELKRKQQQRKEQE